MAAQSSAAKVLQAQFRGRKARAKVQKMRIEASEEPDEPSAQDEEELQGLSTPGQHRQPQLLAAESPAPVLSSPQQPAVRIAESQLSQDDGDSPLQPVSPWLHM